MNTGALCALRSSTKGWRFSLENCGNCKFFLNGDCRRYPPQVVPETYSETVGHSGEYRESVATTWPTMWPQVAPTEFCGEFKSKYEAELTASTIRTMIYGLSGSHVEALS